MKKTKLLTTLGAVALIGAIGVGSTFAYLSATTGPVTNTFEIGNVSFDSDHGLKESTVDRYEEGNEWADKHPNAVIPSDVVKGQYIDTDGVDTWTTDHNAYENLHAGEVVLKDPTVTMKVGSQDAWVFALVENNNVDKLSIQYNDYYERNDDGSYKTDNAGKKIVANVKGWVDVTDAYRALHKDLPVTSAVYAKATKIAGGESSTIFNTVTVDDSVTGTTKFEKIIIKACAVQAAGFDSYEDAISEVAFN